MAEDKTKRQQLEKITDREERILAILREERARAQQKFPLTYALVATFGLVCVFAGFYKAIDRIDLLKDNPIGLLAIGIGILVITGAAYKKLG